MPGPLDMRGGRLVEDSLLLLRDWLAEAGQQTLSGVPLHLC
jgi:hypothetical protein